MRIQDQKDVIDVDKLKMFLIFVQKFPRLFRRSGHVSLQALLSRDSLR